MTSKLPLPVGQFVPKVVHSEIFLHVFKIVSLKI